MNEVRLKILPPWSIYIKELEAMFDADPQIAFNVDWDGTHPSVIISTNNGDKAAALVKLLPEEKEFGNVVLKVVVDCPNMSNRAFVTPKELFETAFDKNPVLVEVISTEGYWYVDFSYIVFANEVVQFFADSLNDPHGVISTLYQNIAEDIFDKIPYPGGIAYCTDVKKIGKSVDEWIK